MSKLIKLVLWTESEVIGDGKNLISDAIHKNAGYDLKLWNMKIRIWKHFKETKHS